MVSLGAEFIASALEGLDQKRLARVNREIMSEFLGSSEDCGCGM